MLIHSSVTSAMRAHARAAEPLECCGALLARRSPSTSRVAVEQAVPVPNRAPDPERSFLIDADAVQRIEGAAAEAGLEVAGFYHSHPGGRPCPSKRDLAAAWPWYRYVVLAGHDMRAWRLRADRSAFDEIPLECAG